MQELQQAMGDVVGPLSLVTCKDGAVQRHARILDQPSSDFGPFSTSSPFQQMQIIATHTSSAFEACSIHMQELSRRWTALLAL